MNRWVRASTTRRRGERGAALVTVLLFMVIVLILITSVLAVTGNEVRISGLHRDSVRALELAHAGIQEAVRRIQSSRPFFPDTDCTTGGFTPSVTLSSNETLAVHVCSVTEGTGFTVYEVRSDATVGVAVRKLSVTVAVRVNEIPPEIVLSRSFDQNGSAGVDSGDVYTETYSIYDALPTSPRRAFAGWYIWDGAGTRSTEACYLWPCEDGTNLYAGHRRLKSESELSDAGTCSGNVPVGSIRADNPNQTAETAANPTPLCGYDTDPKLEIYVLRTADSLPPLIGDLTTFNKELGSADAPSTQSITIPNGGGSKSGYAFTTTTPNGRAGSLAVVVKVNTCAGCGNNVTLSVKAARVSAVGAVQTNCGGPCMTTTANCPANGCSRTVSTGTTYVFPLYNVNLGPFGIGDQLRIEYSFTNSAGGGGSRTVVLETGTINESVLAPWGTEQAVNGDHPSGLGYKYLSQSFTDETGAAVTRYFKTVVTEDWFDLYFAFQPNGFTYSDGSTCDPGLCKTQALKDNPQFFAVPGFPSDAYLQSLINQAPASNTRTGGGTINVGSGLDFGCPPVGSPDPHTPGCNGSDGRFTFVALLNGNYTINSNINGFGTIVVNNGNLTINGTFTYMGTIFVKGGVTLGAGNITIRGGMVTQQLTDLSGNATLNTGENVGNLAVSNDVTVIVGAMWER